MQLIWVAGPAGKVVKLAITTRTVGILVAGLATFLVVLGFFFHWVGLRVAIEHAPELAHRFGGVTSQSEQDKIEATYRAKLKTLDQQVLAVNERLKKLEETKNQVLGRVGLDRLLSFSTQGKTDFSWGQGGPLNLLPRWGLNEWRLDQQMDQSLLQAQWFEKSLSQMQSRWAQDLDRLHQVPTQLPVIGEFLLTSSYGFRIDPITRLPSLHEGIDFVAAVGTPVLATAAGEVIRAEYSGAYGNLVEVEHQQGFVTRYAHLKNMTVQPGEQVTQHAVLGSLGNTGRSTGPHLHYEVLYKGRSMHPAKAMSAWVRD
jgi:murein DD-endopeptidase MepM/ murein hydrolase activator NlpD